MKRTVAERLTSFVGRQDDPDACWHWKGGTTNGGYGVFWDGKKNTTAHRAALELQLGRELLPGMKACHTCDNPPCCNPKHLFEGTQAQNLDDMREKGRRGRTGSKGSGALDPETVREVRRLYDTGKWTHDGLSDKFGVSQSSISRVVLRQTWKHVT